MNNLWQKCINTFNLQLNNQDVYKYIKSLKLEYPNITSENHLFFIFIKNKLGSELIKLSEEYTDLLAWVNIEKRTGDIDWYMFVFDEIEDFLLYEEFYNKIKNNINKELFDFFNNSCPQFIQHYKSY